MPRQSALQALLERTQRRFQVLLTHGDGEVAPSLLQDAARNVGRSPQAGGDGVRKIDGHQQRVNVVHVLQQRFAAIQGAAANKVQQVAARFTDSLGQTIQIGRQVDFQLLR